MRIEMCFPVSSVFDILFFIANAAHESYFTIRVIPISKNTDQVGTASTWIASLALKKSRWTISSNCLIMNSIFFFYFIYDPTQFFIRKNLFYTKINVKRIIGM